MQNLDFTKKLNTTIKCPRTSAKLFRDGSNLCVELGYSGAFGMGEKYNALNQKGRTAINQVEEKFCFQGDKTYCPAPFFWTDTGFGLFVDTCETTTFVFEDKRIVIELPEQAKITVFTGNPQQIVSEYMGILGKAVLPPQWAFGTDLRKSLEHTGGCGEADYKAAGA